MECCEFRNAGRSPVPPRYRACRAAPAAPAAAPPDAEKEDAFISAIGIGRYGDWHLGIDDQEPEGSKSRYHYLFGDFSDLHRCALLDIQVEADNMFYGDIEIAAATLISLLQAHAPATES